MKNKKKIIFIGILLLVIVLIIIFFVTKANKKSYDVAAVQEQCIRYYSENGIRIMDFVDMTALFGTDLDESSDAMFLSNIDTLDDPTLDSMIIVLINTDDPEYYYDIFRSYLDSYIMNLEDLEVVQMYRDSVLKKGNNYVYFILGKDAKIIESEISVHYK